MTKRLLSSRTPLGAVLRGLQPTELPLAGALDCVAAEFPFRKA